MIIRYLFEGQVYRLNITNDAGKRCWWLEVSGETIFIRKDRDVHIASVMADVDSAIRETKDNEARAKQGGMYSAIIFASNVTRWGCL